ncbi:Phosphotransferase enzyme family [Rhizoctonia solani]|uniref:Phosphotransferase enzyme family n=1 Tax=Rhizoctonia solani TaxID=456999 RepID=A0A8H7I720_9AGAM|nr:Phosphotransferase enzyme family [Rhizoctonia solani]
MGSGASDSDTFSTFTYDDTDLEAFSVTGLERTVSEYFGERCTLSKLRGGYHKVYNIVTPADSKIPDVVVGVACSAFPKDKMLSEVYSTNFSSSLRVEYQYIQSRRSRVYDNGKDTGNRSIRQQVEISAAKYQAEGCNAGAEHLAALFPLRFQQAGSLYPLEDEDSKQAKVGPIVSLPLRGPFTSASEYLATPLHVKLIEADRLGQDVLLDISGDDPVSKLEYAKRVLRQAVGLCQYCPGDATIPTTISTPDRPFSFLLNDFRLVNILIDEENGQINGYIDSEGTTIAPLWQVATVLQWIPDPNGDTANWYGGTPEDQRALWSAFHQTMDEHDTTGDWRKAYELGEPYRELAGRLDLGFQQWDERMESWLARRLEWAEKHPGIGIPEGGILIKTPNKMTGE